MSILKSQIDFAISQRLFYHLKTSLNTQYYELEDKWQIITQFERIYEVLSCTILWKQSNESVASLLRLQIDVVHTTCRKAFSLLIQSIQTNLFSRVAFIPIVGLHPRQVEGQNNVADDLK